VFTAVTTTHTATAANVAAMTDDDDDELYIDGGGRRSPTDVFSSTARLSPSIVSSQGIPSSATKPNVDRSDRGSWAGSTTGGTAGTGANVNNLSTVFTRQRDSERQTDRDREREREVAALSAK
jgi:hypothetical protein